MQRSKRECSICQRAISLSNIEKHEIACSRPNPIKLSASERQLKIDPEKRKLRAQKAHKARMETWTKKRKERVDSYPFDELNNAEKRERIFNEQMECCDVCNNKTWNGLPITLELDHISGNRNDETRDNLRLICPNCHSQTDTYKVKNIDKPGLKKYTDDEIVEVLLTEDSLYKVLLKLGMNTHGGNYTRLRRIIKERNLRPDLIF